VTQHDLGRFSQQSAQDPNLKLSNISAISRDLAEI
jgi:hypothetical protein